MPEYEESRLKRAGKKYNQFANRFKLDSHHTIERLGVVTAAFMVSGALVIGGSAVSAHQAGQADLSRTALYTKKFNTSRTNQKGKVTGVFVNPEKTRTLVAMQFDDPDKMPTDVNNYQAYVTAIKGNVDGKPQKVSKPIAGSIVTFAQTGRIGVILDAPEGFGEQLLNVTLKSKEELTSVDESKAGSDYEGAGDSFKTSDQWRVIINPNGSEATTLQALSGGDTLDSRAIYSQAMYKDEELDYRLQLDDTMAEMKRNFDRIKSYEAAMARTSIRVGSDENVRIVPPRMPKEIVGDQIIGYSANQLSSQLKQHKPKDIDGLRDSSDAAIKMDIFNDEKQTNSFLLQSKTTMPGGFNFNWRKHTLNEGFLDEVVPAGQDPMGWINKVSAQGVNARRGVRDVPWTLTNGMKIQDLDRSDAGHKPLLDLYNNAAQAYDNYYKAKRKYQAEQLRTLLIMEVDLRGVANNTQVASGQDHVAVNM